MNDIRTLFQVYFSSLDQDEDLKWEKMKWIGPENTKIIFPISFELVIQMVRMVKMVTVMTKLVNDTVNHMVSPACCRPEISQIAQIRKNLIKAFWIKQIVNGPFKVLIGQIFFPIFISFDQTAELFNPIANQFAFVSLKIKDYSRHLKTP